MGCFSFLCKESGNPAFSTSFDGSPFHLFLLKEGKVIEHMYGNYDSYGRVFNGDGDSFEWKMDWGKVVDLMFDKDRSNGIAMVLDRYYNNTFPTERSDDDPDQGWGDQGTNGGRGVVYKQVEKPFHKII